MSGPGTPAPPRPSSRSGQGPGRPSARGADLRPDEVRTEFDTAAPRYDLMVALNPGYHDHLRAAARSLLAALGTRTGLRLVDLGCGSGASTAALLSQAHDGRVRSVVGVDASAGMLAQARVKPWPPGVRFEQGRAEDLPRTDGDTATSTDGAADGSADLAPGAADGVLATYLFRNVPADDRDDATRRVFDLLAPRGALAVQEYSVVDRRRAAALWTVVCWLVVIPLSAVTTRRTRLYRYLWRSVMDFDSIETFTARLHRAGFADVDVDTVGGWQHGILYTITARKPG
jgi:ubiquinone/menaquinone biosynthesis C-methylase UbiE